MNAGLHPMQRCHVSTMSTRRGQSRIRAPRHGSHSSAGDDVGDRQIDRALEPVNQVGGQPLRDARWERRHDDGGEVLAVNGVEDGVQRAMITDSASTTRTPACSRCRRAATAFSAARAPASPSVQVASLLTGVAGTRSTNSAAGSCSAACLTASMNSGVSAV